MRVVVLAVVATGCLRAPGAFPCTTDLDCGSGRCEPEGFCSVTDPSCASGSRFVEHAGSFANQCVGGTSPDAGIDSSPDSTDGPLVLGPWGAAVELTALNTAADESDPSLTDDALEIFFYSDRTGGLGGADIYRATRPDTASAFDTISHVPELSSTDEDFSPEISADGLTIYLTSDRSGQFEVYITTRPNRGAAFDMPVIDTELSSAANDFTVGISADRLVAIVGQSTMGIGRELFEHTRGNVGASWSTGARRTELGTNSDEVGATLDAQGLNLMFHSDAGQTNGRFDLKTASRTSTSSAFDAPTPITELNTVANSESNAFVSADLRRMVFTINAATGDRDLFETTR